MIMVEVDSHGTWNIIQRCGIMETFYTGSRFKVQGTGYDDVHSDFRCVQ